MIEAVRFDQKRSRSSASAARCSRIITKYAARYPSENLQRVGTLRREPVQDGMPEHALGLSAFDLKPHPLKRTFATCLNKQAHRSAHRDDACDRVAVAAPQQCQASSAFDGAMSRFEHRRIGISLSRYASKYRGAESMRRP